MFMTVILFYSHGKCECVMVSVKPVGRLSVIGKTVNVAIFSDTVKIINVKHCLMVGLILLYPFIPLSVTLITVQSHTSVKQFSPKNLCSHLIKLKLCKIVD